MDKGVQNFMIKGKCNSELTNRNCYDIKPIDAQYMPVWRNRVRLCMLRDVYSFFTEPHDKCFTNSTEYKWCGDNQFAICTRNTTRCPLTEV